MSDEKIKELLGKGGEYYLCARHMNFRGMGDVLQECVPIVKEIKALNISFDEMLRHVERITNQKQDLEKDKFMGHIKVLFDGDEQ